MSDPLALRYARAAGPRAARQSERRGDDAGAQRPPVGIVRRQLGEQSTVQRAQAVVGNGGQVVVERVVTQPDGCSQRAEEPPLQRHRIEELSKRVCRLPVALVAVGGEVAGLVEDQRPGKDDVPLQEPLNRDPPRHNGGRHQPHQGACGDLLHHPSHGVPSLWGGAPIAWVEGERGSALHHPAA